MVVQWGVACYLANSLMHTSTSEKGFCTCRQARLITTHHSPSCTRWAECFTPGNPKGRTDAQKSHTSNVAHPAMSGSSWSTLVRLGCCRLWSTAIMPPGSFCMEDPTAR